MKTVVKEKIKIAPSILSADFARLGDELSMIEQAGADWVHLDIMDGHFVPNLTIGPPVVSSIRKVSKLFFDAHLMIEKPYDYIDAFADAGADAITFHIEVCKTDAEIDEIIQKIKGRNCRAGVSLNPGTAVSSVEKIIDKVDFVLVMSVWPGFGGQKFIPETLEHVRSIRRLAGRDFDIAIDGGINTETVTEAAKAGANIIVAGSAVFGSDNPEQTLKDLKLKAVQSFLKDDK